MAGRARSDLAIGAMFALALVILAATIMAIGNESRLFVAKAEYEVLFPNADGLVVGSPVKVAGVQVGAVSAITLAADPGKPGISVTVGIDRDYAPLVREDSRAALRILQLLSGEKYVEITAGSTERPVLPEGSRLDTLQDPELLEAAAMASQNLNDITVSLQSILTSLERGEGLIGRMITDPEFGQEGMESLRATLDNLAKLSGDLAAGRGFVGRLVYDEEFAGRVDDLGRLIEKLAAVADHIDPERGVLGAMLEDDGAAEQAVEDLAAAAASLRRTAERIERGQGILGQLVAAEPEDGGPDTFASDLRRMTRNLAEISEKINEGEGTLGALVNERVLHDGLEDVVAGVNDSKFARWLMRRYQKRGIEAADEGDGESGTR